MLKIIVLIPWELLMGILEYENELIFLNYKTDPSCSLWPTAGEKKCLEKYKGQNEFCIECLELILNKPVHSLPVFAS